MSGATLELRYKNNGDVIKTLKTNDKGKFNDTAFINRGNSVYLTYKGDNVYLNSSTARVSIDNIPTKFNNPTVSYNGVFHVQSKIISRAIGLIGLPVELRTLDAELIAENISSNYGVVDFYLKDINVTSFVLRFAGDLTYDGVVSTVVKTPLKNTSINSNIICVNNSEFSVSGSLFDKFTEDRISNATLELRYSNGNVIKSFKTNDIGEFNVTAFIDRGNSVYLAYEGDNVYLNSFTARVSIDNIPTEFNNPTVSYNGVFHVQSKIVNNKLSNGISGLPVELRTLDAELIAENISSNNGVVDFYLKDINVTSFVLRFAGDLRYDGVVSTVVKTPLKPTMFHNLSFNNNGESYDLSLIITNYFTREGVGSLNVTVKDSNSGDTVAMGVTDVDGVLKLNINKNKLVIGSRLLITFNGDDFYQSSNTTTPYIN
ncbi:MAG: hypothetical protein LBB45_09160 [Methanobrevibacter sp.]|nr:hypothetical protein [Candidatus Methanovirga basalitermitum]